MNRSERALRVVTVIDWLATAGAETLACRTAAALDRAGVKVDIITLYPDLTERWRLEGTDVGVHCLELRGKRDVLGAGRRLRALLESLSPDVVHAHLFPADLVTVLAARGMSPAPPLVLSEHAESNHRRLVPAIRHLERWTYQHFDRIVCVSPEVERSLHGWIPRAAGRTTVLLNAVEIPSSRWDPDAQFESDLMFVGRFYKQKALDILVRALARMAENGERPTLTVIGEGPREHEYRRLIERTGLDGQVTFLGRRDNAQELMAKGRVLVVPSRYDGLSMVLLEGLSLGMPVIATRVSGAGTVIEDGRNGFLVPPTDEAALAARISEVLADPRAAAAAGARAREMIEEHFAIDDYAARLARLYGELAAPAGAEEPVGTWLPRAS